MKVIEILSKLKEATKDSIIEVQDTEYEGSCSCTVAATSISPVVKQSQNKSVKPIFVVNSGNYQGRQMTMEDFRYNATQCSCDEDVVINGEYPVTDVSYNGLGVVTFYTK